MICETSALCRWNFTYPHMWCSFAHRYGIGGHWRGVVSKNFQNQSFQWSSRSIVVTKIIRGGLVGQWNGSKHQKEVYKFREFRNSRLEKTGHRVPADGLNREFPFGRDITKNEKLTAQKTARRSKTATDFFSIVAMEWKYSYPSWTDHTSSMLAPATIRATSTLYFSKTTFVLCVLKNATMSWRVDWLVKIKHSVLLLRRWCLCFCDNPG